MVGVFIVKDWKGEKQSIETLTYLPKVKTK